MHRVVLCAMQHSQAFSKVFKPFLRTSIIQVDVKLMEKTFFYYQIFFVLVGKLLVLKCKVTLKDPRLSTVILEQGEEDQIR